MSDNFIADAAGELRQVSTDIIPTGTTAWLSPSYGGIHRIVNRAKRATASVFMLRSAVLGDLPDPVRRRHRRRVPTVIESCGSAVGCQWRSRVRRMTSFAAVTEGDRIIQSAAIPSIAIVGAGFTGTLLAVHILRHAKTPMSLLSSRNEALWSWCRLFDGQSLARPTNVRVANMSAFLTTLFPQMALATRRSRRAVELDPAQRARSFHGPCTGGIWKRRQLEDAIINAEPGVVCERLAASSSDHDHTAGFDLCLPEGSGGALDTWRCALATSHRGCLSAPRRAICQSNG